VLLKLGKKADAVSAFESGLKLAPDHRGAAMALARAKSGGL
jgi:cytochrome c-type biogenesis protein CcmH/NrfG